MALRFNQRPTTRSPRRPWTTFLYDSHVYSVKHLTTQPVKVGCLLLESFSQILTTVLIVYTEPESDGLSFQSGTLNSSVTTDDLFTEF